MQFQTTPLPGVVVVEAAPVADDRGHFARVWCREEFQAHGLTFEFDQSSLSFNHKAGTLRGLDFQTPPWEETKLVRVTRGAIFDVAVDLRPDSPTYRQWFSVELTESNHRSLLIPPGCAHGFQIAFNESKTASP